MVLNLKQLGELADTENLAAISKALTDLHGLSGSLNKICAELSKSISDTTGTTSVLQPHSMYESGETAGSETPRTGPSLE